MHFMHLCARSSQNLCQVTVLRICDLAHVYVIYTNMSNSQKIPISNFRLPPAFTASNILLLKAEISISPKDWRQPSDIQRRAKFLYHLYPWNTAQRAVKGGERRTSASQNLFVHLQIVIHFHNQILQASTLKLFHQAWKFKEAFVTSTFNQFKVTKEKQNFKRWTLSQDTLRFFF